MRYRDLLNKIQNLSESQLDREVLVYDHKKKIIYNESVVDLRVSVAAVPGIIDKDFSYLVI